MSYNDQLDVSRRRILKATGTGIGISLASSAGSAGPTSNEVTPEEKRHLRKVASQYGTPRRAREAVRQHGTQLLKKLADEEIIISQHISDLEIDKILSLEEFHNIGEGVMVIGIIGPQRTPTARIHIGKLLGDQELTIAVEPHLQRSYAVLSPKEKPKEASEGTVFWSVEDSAVTTSACIKDCACIITCGNDGSCSCKSVEIMCCDNGTCGTGGLCSPYCSPDLCCPGCIEVCDPNQCKEN